jgi:hypothetical protein
MELATAVVGTLLLIELGFILLVWRFAQLERDVRRWIENYEPRHLSENAPNLPELRAQTR